MDDLLLRMMLEDGCGARGPLAPEYELLLTNDLQASCGSDPTFVRASAGLALVDNKWRNFASGVERVGDYGLWLAALRVNKCAKNYDHSDATGWAKAGDAAATLAPAADAVAVAAKIPDAGNVLLLDNSGGSGAAYAYPDHVNFDTGNTNKHSLQAVARSVGGTGELGWWDVSGSIFTKVGDLTGTTGYARDVWGDLTPGDTDERICFHAPAGEQIYFAYGTCEENAVPTSPIPTTATAATTTRAADTLTLPITPKDSAGAIEIDFTPLGWGGADLGAAQAIIRRVGGACYVIYTQTVGIYATYDGSNARASAIAAADGVTRNLRAAWGAGIISINVDNGASYGSGAYDGALADSGAFLLQAAYGEWAVKNLKCYRVPIR